MPNLRKKKSRISAITLKTRKVERQPHVLVISADPKKKKVACRASYNASPEKKRAASRASYRADPEEKRAASRVASRASGLLTARSSIKSLLFDRAACSGLLVHD